MTSMSLIERLPTELHLDIFERLPDLPTLKEAASTCPIFFNTILNNKISLSKKVVINQVAQVDLNLLNEVLTVWKLSTLDKDEWTSENVESQLERYFNNTEDFSLDKFSLSDALALHRLYNTAYDLAIGFSRKTLELQRSFPIHTTGVKATFDTVLSTSELRRVVRAFLRIDICCYVYGNQRPESLDIDTIDIKFRPDVFFSRLNPWGIEQIACVYQYLLAEIKTVSKSASYLNDDWLVWIAMGRHRDLIIDQLMSYGLARIRKILTADDEKLASPGIFGPEDEYIGPEFLGTKLEHSYLYCEKYVFELFDEEDENKPMVPPAVPETEFGPKVAWEWSHVFDHDSHMALGPHQTPLRDRGYVMWDFERIQKWGVLESPWHWAEEYEWLDQQERLRAEEKEDLKERAMRTGKCAYV
ncbi:MAG: hypothetical protein M1831_000164 [Alyxoria varia]|nr:MAG: hypothetical protein M1831_000164 [Alyxoria varia]